ncbi:MAG: hypothetical protein R3D98_16105 [Candidatus Krumholzibacteriia bacterium]
MPIRFRYDVERDLLIHIGEGHVGIEDIKDLREERRRAGVPRRVANTLTDFRRARFDFDIETLRAYEADLPEDEYAGARHAEIVVDPHPTAILLLWKNWLPDGITVEIFTSAEPAYRWLGVERRDGDLDF